MTNWAGTAITAKYLVAAFTPAFLCAQCVYSKVCSVCSHCVMALKHKRKFSVGELCPK